MEVGLLDGWLEDDLFLGDAFWWSGLFLYISIYLDSWPSPLFLSLIENNSLCLMNMGLNCNVFVQPGSLLGRIVGSHLVL